MVHITTICCEASEGQLLLPKWCEIYKDNVFNSSLLASPAANSRHSQFCHIQDEAFLHNQRVNGLCQCSLFGSGLTILYQI